MPDGFLTLVIICAVALVVLKLIKASISICIGAVALAIVVWACINILPTLAVVL